jgi:hypothetical protein
MPLPLAMSSDSIPSIQIPEGIRTLRIPSSPRPRNPPLRMSPNEPDAKHPTTEAATATRPSSTQSAQTRRSLPEGRNARRRAKRQGPKTQTPHKRLPRKTGNRDSHQRRATQAPRSPVPGIRRKRFTKHLQRKSSPIPVGRPTTSTVPRRGSLLPLGASTRRRIHTDCIPPNTGAKAPANRRSAAATRTTTATLSDKEGTRQLPELYQTHGEHAPHKEARTLQ